METKSDCSAGPLERVVRAHFEKWISAPPFEHMCDRNSENSAWPGAYKRYETELAWEAWQAAWGSQQAEIDRLMLEFCPDEMTPEQVAEWAAHQKPEPNAEVTGRPPHGPE